MVAFALVMLSGDPVAIMLPTHATEQDRQTLRHELGLDQPVGAQYVRFVGRLGQGELGGSVKFNQPVLPLIVGKLPLTMALVVAAISLAILIGIPLGILSGARANGPLDVLTSVLALLTISFPPFWVGLMLILIVADYLRLLPTSGTGDLKHLILPAVTLSLPPPGPLTRPTLATLLDTPPQPYATS